MLSHAAHEAIHKSIYVCVDSRESVSVRNPTALCVSCVSCMPRCRFNLFERAPGAKIQTAKTYDMPTMMLLIGMNISLTKKPMNPMIAKPTDVACAIFENSASRNTNSASA